MFRRRFMAPSDVVVLATRQAQIEWGYSFVLLAQRLAKQPSAIINISAVILSLLRRETSAIR
jgi:hypothetical protein